MQPAAAQRPAMKVQLLMSEWCPSCHRAERVWREVAEERDIRFEVLDMAQPEGREPVGRLHIRSVPSVVIDGRLKAVGVLTREEVLELVKGAPPRAGSTIRHVGLGMALSGRVAVLSSVVYPWLAGASLPWNGALSRTARPAPLHLFTLGFFVFMVYGLGEHMLPRFTGNPIRSGPIAWLQSGLAHAGAPAMACGFAWQLVPLTVTGAVLAWSALLVFNLRVLPVLWPRFSAHRPPVDPD